MQVSIGNDTDLPISGSTLVSLGPQAVVLRLDLGDAEVLDGIELRLVRAPDVAPSPTVLTSTQLTTDGPVLPLSNVTWLAADWGQTRALSRLSLGFAAKPNPLIVRLKVARGQSSWYPPPGPQQFTLGAATTLVGAFPNTVADRMMLEFFVDTGASGELPATVSLTTPSPLAVTFGQHARDLTVGLLGHRVFLRASGEAPAGDGIAVDGLLEHLEQQLDGDLRGRSIELELRSEVAGQASIEWSLSSHQLVQRFEPALDEDTFAVGFDESLVRPLPLPADGLSELLGLDLAVRSTPQLERVVLAPSTSPPPNGDGQLARPLYQVAQALSFDDPRPLGAVDLYVRALTTPSLARLRIHGDDQGRPSATPVAELDAQTIDTSSSAPGWITFALDEPQVLPAALYWLVLSVDEGELSWLVEDPRPASAHASSFRRDSGPWLTRGGSGERPWTMARLRVIDASPPAAPSLALVGFVDPPSSASQPPDLIEPLAIDDDGRVRWSAPDPAAPPQLAALGLRVATAVATAVTLSDLELRFRPTEG